MCANVAGRSDETVGTAFRPCPLADALDSSRRRTVLSVLADRGEPVREEVLSVYVAAEEAGVPPGELNPDHRQTVRRALHHQALPKLESVDLVVRESDPRRVAVADDLTFSVDDLLTRVESLPADSWTLLVDLLSNGRRRAVASVVVYKRNWSVGELAAAVADRIGEQESGRVAVSLRHVHLPRLSELGVVEFQGDGVAVPDPPPMPDGWLDPDASLPAALFGRDSSVSCPDETCG